MKHQFSTCLVVMVGAGLTAFLAGCVSAPAPSNTTTPWIPPSRAQNQDTIWDDIRAQKADFTNDQSLAEALDIALQKEIAIAAKKTGIYTDAKPFHPHLTIGRVRSARNVGALLTVLEPCRDTAFGTITIDRVLLMKSDLTDRGAIYTLLHESRLVPQPSETVKKNKKMLKLINHETHVTHEMDED